MSTFDVFSLPQPLLEALKRLGFKSPTPIQAKAIPVALEGQDVLGSAQTGTGKTAAFGIPLVAYLLTKPQAKALVITPTRELASQVMATIKALLGKAAIKSTLLIGGDSMSKQLSQLASLPRLIVGTPGRINDHLTRGTLSLKEADFLVLDEMDRMLDMGFGIQLEKIIKQMPKKRQTLMFSATLPTHIEQLAQQYLHRPARIAVGQSNHAAPLIKQENIILKEEAKYSTLLDQLSERGGSVLVFMKTKHAADKLAKKLTKDDYRSEALHGDLRQTKREQVVAAFRNQKYRILVATDIAARGLDISHIEHVINYDLPQAAEDYIHRIGRTGRAGAMGFAVNFITEADRLKWKAIHKLLHPGKPQEDLFGPHVPRDEPKRRRGRKAGPSSKVSFFKQPKGKVAQKKKVARKRASRV